MFTLSFLTAMLSQCASNFYSLVPNGFMDRQILFLFYFAASSTVKLLSLFESLKFRFLLSIYLSICFFAVSNPYNRFWPTKILFLLIFFYW